VDKNDFRAMMGGTPKRETPPEEREAIEQRLDSGEATLGDIFSDTGMDRIFENMEKDKQAILEHFKLNDAPEGDGIGGHDEAMYDMLSKEQSEQLRKAESAYGKRRYPTRDRDDHTNSLLTFAATNPPEVLRRHVWRLQRGLDEPMFGTELQPLPNRLRSYEAAIIIQLCDNCTTELYEQTLKSGAETHGRARGSTIFKYLEREHFYARDDDGYGGFYLFRYEDKHVEREVGRSLFGNDKFPYAMPKTCHRCGFNEVDEWREAFGSRE
jgi:hypothetical protein